MHLPVSRDRQTLSSSMVVAAVDEDGLGRPITACNSTSDCNNIVPFWYHYSLFASELVAAPAQCAMTEGCQSLACKSSPWASTCQVAGER